MQFFPVRNCHLSLRRGSFMTTRIIGCVVALSLLSIAEVQAQGYSTASWIGPPKAPNAKRRIE